MPICCVKYFFFFLAADSCDGRCTENTRTSPEPPKLNHEWCTEVILPTVCRKYILVESRQKTFHLLRLLRTIQTAGWLLTQQQKRHNISALLHFNTLASHAASVSTRPPPPTPLFCTTPSQIKGKEKISLAHLHVSQQNLAPHVVLSARFSGVLVCERIQPVKVQRVQRATARLPSERARAREFSTGVSLLKIHRKSVEMQTKKEKWWEGANEGNNKNRRLDVRVDHGPWPTAVGGGGRHTAFLKWQWIKSIKKRGRHCLGVWGGG